MNTTQLIEERGTTHGKFEDNARLTVELQQVIQTSPNWADAPDTVKVATFMILHKLARMFSGDIFHPDHAKDIQGYAELILQTTKPSNTKH